MGDVSSPKVALISGAASGIGQAVAVAYAKAGIQVAGGYFSRDPHKPEHTEALIKAAGGTCVMQALDVSETDSVETARACEVLGAKVHAVSADVGDVAGAHSIIDRCVEEFGGIDILVNNAGMLTQAACIDLTVEMWDEMIRVDLRSVFLCTQRALPHMIGQGWGRVINIASQLGIITPRPRLALSVSPNRLPWRFRTPMFW
jgi:3-oxoacyl-[acyl-carrier protein] reductase